MLTIRRARWFSVLLLALAFGAAGCGDDDVDYTPPEDDTEPPAAEPMEPATAPAVTEGFVPIPAGTFLMGSPEYERGRRPDETQREVTLSHAFEIAATETTQGDFAALLGYDPAFFPIIGWDLDRPVEQVSWYDALAFANRMSEAAGYIPCYVLSAIVCEDDRPGDAVSYCATQGGIRGATVEINGVSSVYDCEGYRLPTEAEWEYAARAGTTTPLYSAEIVHVACTPVDPNLDRIGWYCGNAKETTHTVARKEPNAWGLFDTSGNVAEWTWDVYARDAGGDATDPEGPADGAYRVVRGGAYRYYAALRLRSAYRAAHTPDFRTRLIGFRLARTLPEVEAGVPEAPAAPTSPAPPAPTDDGDLPDSLPFEFTRPNRGEPLTPEEVADFTRKITGFWKQVQYFHWMNWHSHGMVEDNPEGMPDFKLFWQDVQAIKDGDLVTFQHRGWADNLMIQTGKVFNNAAAGYLASGDPAMGRFLTQICKGMVALFLGMMWDEEDPEDYLMARAVFTQDHYYEEEGRHAYVDYGPVRHEQYDWNSHTIPNPGNPYWGSIWVRNMRSKDDVPHIYRTVPWLQRLAREAPDADLREAAARALQYLRGFARDTVDSGYFIRTKDIRGNAYVPLNEWGLVNDLASLIIYTKVDPLAECDARLAAALIAYGSHLGENCGNGIGPLYETVATQQHYYNWAIIRYFHVAAITNALMAGANQTALELLRGLAERVDTMVHDDQGRIEHAEWDADGAAYLLAAATAGLPLTAEEARLIRDQYSAAVDHYATWPYWDLWDPSVPDGEVPHIPSRWSDAGPVIADDEMTFLIEYCGSPFKNETGAMLVDCEIVLNPERWGE